MARQLPRSFLAWSAAILAVSAALFGLTLLPWSYFGTESFPEPPEALDLPWVSWPFGFAFVGACVSLTALALWFDRRSATRYEPLAVVALCLSVLGHGEAVRSARVLARFPDSWPLNLVDVAIGVLVLAAVVGAAAWVRILLSRSPTRGRVFATCAVVCSLGTAWIVHALLVELRFVKVEEGGLELPVADHSRRLQRHVLHEPWPVAVIDAEGTASAVALEAVARDVRSDGLSDAPIVIRADRRASWSSVRGVLQRARDAKMWKVHFSTRWEEPPVETRILAYMDVEGVEDPRATPDHVLRVSGSGTFEFDDQLLTDRGELSARVDPVSVSRAGGIVLIDPEEEAEWGHVIEALSTSCRSFENIYLGPFDLLVYPD